jgi:hypothetical protein
MKIDYLENGSSDCPLIRIYRDEPEFCARLFSSLNQLSSGEAKEVSLTALPGVEPAGSCTLIAQVIKSDRGIVHKEGNSFFWMLTSDSWQDVAGLIEPFCQFETKGFQWLDQVPASDARVLISRSPDGCW